MIIEMIWWTGLAPWEFEFPLSGSLASTFLIPKPGPFTLHPQPEIRNPKLEVRHLKPETRNQRPEIRQPDRECRLPRGLLESTRVSISLYIPPSLSLLSSLSLSLPPLPPSLSRCLSGCRFTVHLSKTLSLWLSIHSDVVSLLQCAVSSSSSSSTSNP